MFFLLIWTPFRDIAQCTSKINWICTTRSLHRTIKNSLTLFIFWAMHFTSTFNRMTLSRLAPHIFTNYLSMQQIIISFSIAKCIGKHYHSVLVNIAVQLTPQVIRKLWNYHFIGRLCLTIFKRFRRRRVHFVGMCTVDYYMHVCVCMQ